MKHKYTKAEIEAMKDELRAILPPLVLLVRPVRRSSVPQL
jgi:hypothetical protein